MPRRTRGLRYGSPHVGTGIQPAREPIEDLPRAEGYSAELAEAVRQATAWEEPQLVYWDGHGYRHQPASIPLNPKREHLIAEVDAKGKVTHMPIGALLHLPKAARMWEHVYQGQIDAGLGKGRAAASAWSAVQKAGYYKGADGRWHAPGNPHGCPSWRISGPIRRADGSPGYRVACSVPGFDQYDVKSHPEGRQLIAELEAGRAPSVGVLYKRASEGRLAAYKAHGQRLLEQLAARPGWAPMEPGSDDWLIHEPSGVRVEYDDGTITVYGPRESSPVGRYGDASEALAEIERRIKGKAKKMAKKKRTAAQKAATKRMIAANKKKSSKKRSKKKTAKKKAGKKKGAKKRTTTYYLVSPVTLGVLSTHKSRRLASEARAKKRGKFTPLIVTRGELEKLKENRPKRRAKKRVVRRRGVWNP